MEAKKPGRRLRAVPSHAPSPRNSLRSSRIFSEAEKRSEFDATENSSLGINRVARAFANSQCASFAVFLPDSDQLTELLEIESWDPVDLLILPFHGLIKLAVKARPSAVAREKKPTRIKSLLGLMDYTPGTLGNYQHHDDNTSISQLRLILASRTTYRIAEVNVLDLLRLFLERRSQLGLMTFAMFMLQQITDDFANISMPITGFYFSNCVATQKVFPLLTENFINLFKALQEIWIFNDAPIVILIDEFGLTSWDRLRNSINGLVLKNPLLQSSGKIILRHNSDRAIFESQMKLLKSEISFRKDFSVFCIECVDAPLSFHVLNHIVKFYSGHNFKYWISMSDKMDSVFDIAPTKLADVAADMLEISTSLPVVSCHQVAEKSYAYLLLNQFTGEGVLPNHFEKVLSDLSENSAFWRAHKSVFENLQSSDFASCLYEKPEFPSSALPFGLDLFDSNTAYSITQLLKNAPKPEIPTFSSMKLGIQHKRVGVATNPPRQEYLGNLVLQVIWDLHAKNLLFAFRYNNDLVTDPDAFSPPFLSMLTLLDQLTDAALSTLATQWIFSLMGSKTRLQTVNLLRTLSAGLRCDTISVWFAKKVAFIPKDKTEYIDYDPIWSLTDERNGKLFIFLSDGHPSIEEAILHSFMKHSGLKTGLCVMIEALVSAQKMKHSNFTIPIPTRIIYEVKTTHRSKLLTMIRNSATVIKSIHKTATTKGEAEYLASLSKYINQCIEHVLVTEEAFTDSMLTMLENEYAPTNLAEETLVEYFGRQTRSLAGLSEVGELCSAVKLLLHKYTSNNERELSYALCCIAYLIRKVCRHCAYLELDLAITAMSTQILPEKDQVAVCLEMATTQSTLQEIFCLSSLQLAQKFHAAQREKMFELENSENAEEPNNSVINLGDEPYKNLDFRMGRMIANSYIYIYPILIDLLMKATLSSGLFLSDRMKEKTLQAASITILVSFPFIGALMNSFGRTMSFYFYQMSLTVMIIAVSHRLVASISFLIFTGLLAAACIYICITQDLVLMVMGAIYAFLFGLYMIMYAILVAFRDPAVAVYNSPGPRACIQSILLLLPAPFFCRFILVNDYHSELVWAIYEGNIAAAVIFMLYRYSKISREFLDWPSAVRITSKEHIFAAYESEVKRPIKLTDESEEEMDRKMRLWERNASDWFAERLQEAIKSPIKGMDKRIKDRISQLKWERPLMSWFMERSAVAPSSIKMFSAEWDALAKQALETLSRKYQVDKLNRGALLFQLEAPAIVFGFLYFVIIFIDKFSILFGTGTIENRDQQYTSEAGLAFATIYLLLSSGFLELTITSSTNKLNRFEYAPLSTVEHPYELIREYQAYTERIYQSELKIFAIRVSGVLIVLSGITAGYGYFTDTLKQEFLTFGTASASFTGLLIGLFNKLFVVTDEHLLNKYLVVSIVAGLTISSTLIRVMDDQAYSLLATGIGCWGFALCCLFARYSERTRSPYYDISIGPRLRTSGQKMIGFETNDLTNSECELLSKKLASQKDAMQVHSPHYAIGLECIALLEKAMQNASRLDLHPSTAYDFVHVLQTSLAWFKSGTLVVREVPGRLCASGVEYSAIGVSLERQKTPTRASRMSFLRNMSPQRDNTILDIYVTNMNGLTAIAKALLLTESIVHEVSETFGWSHTRACMMEVLMNRCWNTDSEVPRRIQRELTILGKKHGDRIVSNTESTVTHFSTFGVDVNRFWGREYFSNDERKFIISVIKEWNQLVENGMDSSDVKQLCADIFERAPSTMAKSLSILIFRSEKQFAPISLILEHCVLMSQISRKICSMAKNNAGKTARLADPSLAVGRSNLRHLSDAINIHFAVYYFAITCDSSFSREVSHLPAFTRIPLCLLYCFNLKIFDCVNQVLLFNRSNTIKDLQRRSDLGITRRHHMNEGTLRAIEVLEGADVLYTTIINARQSIEEDLDSNTEYLELHRFSGPKPKDWIPKDTDKPIAKVMVEKSCEAYRIVNEKFLNSKGEVGKTHLYHYNTTSDMLPASRSVFDRDAKNNAIKLCESPVETHDFYTSGPLLGRVKFAQLKRIHKETKQAMTLSAEFMYNIQTIPIISKTPSAILFQRKDLPGWKVVVECVPFSDSESPLQPLMVKYNAGAGSERILIKYDYSHPKHTVTKAVIESSGLAIATPVEISNDVFGILHLLPFKGVMDSCELLTRDLTPLRRKKFSWSYPFIQVDAVDYFSFPYTTRHQRDILWATWRDGKIPGVFARILDQNILRREQKLYQYWMYRFKGKLMEAVQFLEANRDQLNSILYVADRPATRSRLQIRFSDLLIMGNGGDSEQISSFDQSDNGNLPEDTLEAVCLDSGTWPTGGGGVGSCRRDVVDSLSSVRWTAIAEIAEMELEKKDYQIEKNIKAITYLPIFDNDLGSPMENFYKTTSFGDLRLRANKTTTDVIVSEFVPLIGRLVDAIMTEKLDTNRILQDENTIICLYRYFRTHDWKLSWNHPATQRAWVSLYLERAKAFEKSGRLLRHESPTLAQVSMLFTLVSRLLLILSKEIPNIPVVHVSHHGIQGLIAVISKAIHGSSVIVWDHGMLLRERMYALCRDGMPVFTQIGFIGLTRLCSRLIYHRADYVTPCTNIQNVMWAAHLAGGKYLNDFEKLSLHAKCSAVLNGMNLKKFSIKRELARKTPTAVMLSHISPLKDVMNAIKAAYHIVHEFKLKSYELHVYGSPEVDMSYTLTCRMAIKELNLESNVYLKGLGNPALVLPTGWIFVNSSITEGLPLALGEAGLCGLPVVCTNVGGSLEVISDIATSSLYGAIVPPSRPRQLALGQLQVLAMCNGLDTFVDPSICHSPTVQELVASGTANLEHRIMDPQIGQLREKLGEQFGRKTQSVFSITRYCREHEQVLWLGELYSRKSKT